MISGQIEYYVYEFSMLNIDVILVTSFLCSLKFLFYLIGYPKRYLQKMIFLFVSISEI